MTVLHPGKTHFTQRCTRGGRQLFSHPVGVGSAFFHLQPKVNALSGRFDQGHFLHPEIFQPQPDLAAHFRIAEAASPLRQCK